jgi:hypothetical protein
MPVDPSRYHSEHHEEYCPDHGELLDPIYASEEAFPIKYVCLADGRVWTREELATR